MKITVGIPAYNEEKNIAKIIVGLKKIADQIIVCDDGSSDMTGDISKNLGAIVISHKKNMGYGVAINSIFQKAKELNSDLLVTFDADGQHRVEDIPKLLIEPSAVLILETDIPADKYDKGISILETPSVGKYVE